MIAGLLIGLVLGVAAGWLVVRYRYAARVAVLEEARAALPETMKALAADALATNNESFLQLAKTQLEQLQQKTTHELEQRKQAMEHIVTPIRESLEKVDGKLQQLEVARKGAYSELSTQVRQLAETQVQLRDETGNLVSALRDRPNVRGRWGEIQLRRVVEMAGLGRSESAKLPEELGDLAALVHDNFARHHLTHQRDVARINSHLAFNPRQSDHIHVFGIDCSVRCYDFEFERFCHGLRVSRLRGSRFNSGCYIDWPN